MYDEWISDASVRQVRNENSTNEEAKILALEMSRWAFRSDVLDKMAVSFVGIIKSMTYDEILYVW